MNDFLNDYRLLGLAPGCSLPALKAARRRLIKTWHPDRFPDSADERERAEERIKHINAAFDRLIEYHRNFGKLPSSPRPIPALSPDALDNARSSGPQSVSSARSSASSIGRRERLQELSDRLQTKSGQNPIAWLIVLVVIAFLGESIVTDLRQLDSADSSTTETPHHATGDGEDTSTRSPDAAPVKPDKTFTVGDTIDDVYAIQGPPTFAGSGVWHYGKSKVFFVDGRVTSYEINPENPLYVTTRPNTRSDATVDARMFTIGSTKAEVRALHGAPLVETDTLWDYGLSKVYFRDNHVIGWESSPTQPLKARK